MVYKNTGFIGVGNMASAMISGMTGSGGYPWEKIYLYDLNPSQTEKFAAAGAVLCSSISELYSKCDCIVLSVKPQVFPDVLHQIAAVVDGRRVLYISIGAGISTETVSDALGGAPVVRALPNTPMLIGKGVSAICRNEAVANDEYKFACSIFEAAGDVVKIDETEMNRIISVTSSAPAYVFMFIKAICDGACAQGLDGEKLKSSVCRMVIGAAEMLEKSDRTPDELISMVCSKGGTTERAVLELNEYKFSDGIISAMNKCTARADELGALKK